jgi:hypothetical protein
MHCLNVILATQERYRWTSVTGSLARCHLFATLVYRVLFFFFLPCYVLIIAPFSALCYLTSATEEVLSNTIGKFFVELV